MRAPDATALEMIAALWLARFLRPQRRHFLAPLSSRIRFFRLVAHSLEQVEAFIALRDSISEVQTQQKKGSGIGYLVLLGVQAAFQLAL
jgi:hypothetical protein